MEGRPSQGREQDCRLASVRLARYQLPMGQPGFHSKQSDKEQEERRRTQGTPLTKITSLPPLVFLIVLGVLVYFVFSIAAQQ